MSSHIPVSFKADALDSVRNIPSSDSASSPQQGNLVVFNDSPHHVSERSRCLHVNDMETSSASAGWDMEALGKSAGQLTFTKENGVQFVARLLSSGIVFIKNQTVRGELIC